MKIFKQTLYFILILFSVSGLLQLFNIEEGVYWVLCLSISIIIFLFRKKLFSSSDGYKKHNIPDDIVNKHRIEVISKFISGNSPVKFETNILFKKGEHLIYDLPNIQICEEKTIKIKGNHSGFSIRVMKGVSYRFGDFEASSEKKVVPIDSGNFILTNKRMIFSGAKKSVDFPLSKIVAITPVDNGVLIDRSGKQNVEYFIGLDSMTINMTLIPDASQIEEWDEGVVKLTFNGYDIKRMVQESINNDY